MTKSHVHTRVKVDSDSVIVLTPSSSSEVFIVVITVVSDNFANGSLSLGRLFLCTGSSEDLAIFVLSTRILFVDGESIDGMSPSSVRRLLVAIREISQDRRAMCNEFVQVRHNYHCVKVQFLIDLSFLSSK